MVPLHPYVSELAARALAESPTGGCVEINGTLAFFDISGFTTITERLAGLGRQGAEHINDILNFVFHRLIDEVFHFGGDVLEFGGDAMVVLYAGADHRRRAAQAAARMFKAIGDVGRLTTPAGKVRLGMSCGMASGSQTYYLLGSSRRALVVAGSVSTAMARLEAAADRGQALVCEELASSLPRVGAAARGRRRVAAALQRNPRRSFGHPVDAHDAGRPRHVTAAARGVPIARRCRSPRW